MVAGKAVVAGLSAVSLVTLLSGIGYHFKPYFSGEDGLELYDAEEGGAIAGRIVAVPAQTYIEVFKSSLKLGQCPLVMKDNAIVRCDAEFKGTAVFIPKGKTTVDVTRVETTEDILNHIMGGVGVTVGVLGLVSVTPKVKVAVTTKTSSKTLNLVSSYEVNLGAHTLHHPVPVRVIGDQALYLSEIEYGGNEVFLVTLEFESESKKTDVEVSVTFKIFFWSITAKVRYVVETSKSTVGCRIQLKSSWREDYIDQVDESYSSAKECLPRVEALEAKYMQGPAELRRRQENIQNYPKLHYFYYFSSWKQSPYGAQANQALVNHDLEFLTEQTTELQAVIERIKKMPTELQKREVLEWNTTVAQKADRLAKGLQTYHTMTLQERQDLRNVYGQERAPQYYRRKLDQLLS